MNPFKAGLCGLMLLAVLAVRGHAQGVEKGPEPVILEVQSPFPPPGDEPESLTHWEWYQEVALTRPPQTPWFDFIVPQAVFGKARDDLRDLRLFDARGREVPYALRVLRAETRQELLPGRAYNRSSKGDGPAELRLDLGERPDEHNHIDVNVTGTNYRRRLQLQGSDADGNWSDLLGAEVVDYDVGGQTIRVRDFRYPVSRFRYLRLLVFPEPRPSGAPADRPEIESASVYRTTQIPGEDVTTPVYLQPREPVPTPEGPGSAWLFDLGDSTTPCERLSFDVQNDTFSRPYRLETADPDQPRLEVARGEWRRRAKERRPLEIHLPTEPRVNRLRLVVTDYRNPPLEIGNARYTAAARQVVFAGTPDLAGPLRLYFGNPEAKDPGYDFARNLTGTLEPAPVRLTPATMIKNPDYRPPEAPPLPWTERWPWLVYTVLGLASLVLLGLLGLLGRAAIARQDRTAAPVEPPPA
jgi:hypothetical protein